MTLLLAKTAQTVLINGISYSTKKFIRGEKSIALTVDVPVAKAGTVTSWVSGSEGAITLLADPGYLIGDHVDVYWDVGCRRGMTVTDPDGNVISVTGGTGDNLPTTAYAVTMAKPVSYSFGLTGNELEMLSVLLKGKGIATLRSSGSTEQFAFSAKEEAGYLWDADSGIANPVAGDTILTCELSQASSAEVMEASVLAVLN